MDSGPMSCQDSTVKELVDTERRYVEKLEELCDLKKALEQSGVIPGEAIHRIFLNIDAIVDVQRRFLQQLETTNSMSHTGQKWGAPFVMYEESFKVYEPFIANYRKGAQLVGEMFDKIQTVGHPLACSFSTLDGYLMSPLSRLAKYPLILKDLKKRSKDDAIESDLSTGILATERILVAVNEAMERDVLDGALEDLGERVTDWKTYQLDQFGKLILYGTYAIVLEKYGKGKDYEIYLFERILLCCKEVRPNKSNDEKAIIQSNGPKTVRKCGGPLQLRGRIFMKNITNVVVISRQVQIWWNNDVGVENFLIEFNDEMLMKRWSLRLLQQQKANGQMSQKSPVQSALYLPGWSSQDNNLKNQYDP